MKPLTQEVIATRIERMMWRRHKRVPYASIRNQPPTQSHQPRYYCSVTRQNELVFIFKSHFSFTIATRRPCVTHTKRRDIEEDQTLGNISETIPCNRISTVTICSFTKLCKITSIDDRNRYFIMKMVSIMQMILACSRIAVTIPPKLYILLFIFFFFEKKLSWCFVSVWVNIWRSIFTFPLWLEWYTWKRLGYMDKIQVTNNSFF
jgi:hypothetical protein